MTPLVATFVAVLVLLLKQDAREAFALGGFLLIVYIPMSYYTDLWLYKRRQRKDAEARSAPRPKDKD